MISLAVLAAAALPGWSLIWSDEFDNPGRPDSKKWTYETGHIRNEEMQFYTDNRGRNARVEDGCLLIEARKDDWHGNPVTSASLTTQVLASWTYGRIEVRAKVPTGRGTWPAIWMLGDDIPKVGWPKCGEIDIMENVGYDPDKAVFTVHSTDDGGEKHAASGASVTVPNLPADFHVYAVEWDAEKIRWFMDDKLVHTFIKGTPGVQWAFDKPQYLILNLAIGGTWGGQQGVDDSIFPAKYLIDYVRVYKPEPKS